MRIKSYFAHAVEDAVAQARQELGSDAMLMNSRKTPPETRHLGDYEVVFAMPEDAPAETPDPHQGSEPGLPASGDRLSNEVAELRRQMEGMRRTLARSAGPPGRGERIAPGVAEAYAALTGNDVPAELARDLVEAADRRVAGTRTAASRGPDRAEARAFDRALVEEMESRCTADATLGRPGQSPAVVALVGPPGAGKTSTLVKLAVNYGLTGRRPVVLLSADNYRVAAAEQLRAYASILGVTFQAVETTGALAQHLEEHHSKDLILIDTPGFGYGDLDSGAELASFLSSRTGIDTHLVLTASMKPADLPRVIDAYEVFRPHHLLFTRLDETASCGSIFSEAVRTGKPVSFFTTGQRIPEDLEVATRERLVSMALSGRGGHVLSAA
jgi:flagellar biosynthesis protein FlhF